MLRKATRSFICSVVECGAKTPADPYLDKPKNSKIVHRAGKIVPYRTNQPSESMSIFWVIFVIYFANSSPILHLGLEKKKLRTLSPPENEFQDLFQEWKTKDPADHRTYHTGGARDVDRKPKE